MDEYVTKEKVLAQLERCARDPYHESHYIRDAVISTIRRMEAADVQEVVRCKDCVWYLRSMIKQDGTIDERYKPDWCDLYRRVREETYFCADGERKDNEID